MQNCFIHRYFNRMWYWSREKQNVDLVTTSDKLTPCTRWMVYSFNSYKMKLSELIFSFLQSIKRKYNKRCGILFPLNIFKPSPASLRES